jgi:hypothetical protein
MDDRSVSQCFDDGHAKESSEIEILDSDLAAVGVEIRADKCQSLLFDSLDILQTPDTGRLLSQNPVKLWVDAVSIDHDGHKLSRRNLDWTERDLAEGPAHNLHHFVVVALDNGCDQRLLAREVLIKRSDADTGDLRNPICARAIVSFSH